MLPVWPIPEVLFHLWRQDRSRAALIQRLNKELSFGPGKKTHHIKAPAAKPEDLTLILGLMW